MLRATAEAGLPKRSGTLNVFVSMDIEGVAGITGADQTGRNGGPDYERARRLMVGEANAAVAGAFDAGATAVTVCDSHGQARNLLPDEVDPRARLIQGIKPWRMVEGLDSSFGAALFCGYHARASMAGVLSHTHHSTSVHRVHVDGREVGEIGLNGFYAGCFGVPVALIAGDDQACTEAEALFPGVVTAVTKRAITRYSADMLSPELARRLIRERAAEAVAKAGQGALSPVAPVTPVQIRVEFHDAGQADAAALMPGTERVDGVTLVYTAVDFPTAVRAFRTWLELAR
jgi:D-amino peptidase